MIGNDTHVTSGRLIHLAKPGKTYFVTFVSLDRRVLNSCERDVIFDTSMREQQQSCWIDGCVIMPDHVHIVLTPYDSSTLKKIIGDIKSVSAHRIGGRVWQKESFDHIVRSHESIRQKCEYIAMNPVRKGLVDVPYDWPWLFRAYKV